MKEAEFREWIVRNKFYKTSRQVSDCISRVKRVERAFDKYGIDIDQEFDREGAITIVSAIVMEGHTKEHELYPDLDLPFESPNRTMSVVCNAFKRYVAFRSLSENKFTEELLANKYMKNIMKSCMEKVGKH